MHFEMQRGPISSEPHDEKNVLFSLKLLAIVPESSERKLWNDFFAAYWSGNDHRDLVSLRAE